MQKIKVPRFVDSMTTLWWWEMDELLVALITFAVIGILMKELLLAFVLMWVCGYLFKKAKGKSQRGAIIHSLYWIGLIKLTDKYKNGQDREYGG